MYMYLCFINPHVEAPGFKIPHVKLIKVQKTPCLSSLGHLKFPAWLMAHATLPAVAFVANVKAWSMRVRGRNFRRDGTLSHSLASLSPLSRSLVSH